MQEYTQFIYLEAWVDLSVSLRIIGCARICSILVRIDKPRHWIDGLVTSTARPENDQNIRYLINYNHKNTGDHRCFLINIWCIANRHAPNRKLLLKDENR
jgi:hypothetical protein